MSVQLALLFTIWITQHVHNTNANDNYINFAAYKKQWVKNGIPFKFLSRDEEKRGEEGMFKQNAEATQQTDLLFKHHYILIPVGSTTSQPLIAKNGQVKKFEIPYAFKFGAKQPYPKLDIVKKFVRGIRNIRKVKFPQTHEEVPVIFIKSISWGLNPEKGDDSYKTWCEQHDNYMQRIKPPTPNNQPDDSTADTYTKLRYITNENDNFYIFLPDRCMGMGYRLKSGQGQPIPQITFAWADYFASEEAKKSENKNKFVAVGDIGGGSKPTAVKYKGGSNPTDREEKKPPPYAFAAKGKTKKEIIKDCQKKKPAKCKPVSANELFEGTQKKCENTESANCKKASTDLAQTFIDSITKVASDLNINKQIIQVKQTGRIRAVYYHYVKHSMPTKKKVSNMLRHRKQKTRYERLLNEPLLNKRAHVGLSDYYYGYDDEYDNDNIDSLYYEAANDLLRAENNFGMAQKIKQKYDANKQRNGYY